MTAVRVARTLEEVEALRPDWERVTITNPEADIDVFRTVVESSPDVLRPHVVVLDRPGAAPALAVARLEQRTIDLKVGYRTLAQPRLRVLSVVYAGIAGAADEEAYGILLEELYRAVRDGEAEMLCVAKLHADSRLCELARLFAPRLCRDYLPVVLPRTDVAVPGEFDEFLKSRSRNTRDNVKRYGRKLERAHEGALEVRSFRKPAELDEALFAMESVAATTYQRALGVGFRDEPLQRALLETAAHKGHFRAWVLSIAGEPAAFWYGLAYGETFYIGSPGYDPAHGDLRVGQYLQMQMMRDLCAEPGINRVDYGFGDAQYKRSFGDNTWDETDVLMFAPRPRALGINLLRGGVGLATRVAKRVLGPARVGTLKRRARRARVQPA